MDSFLYRRQWKGWMQGQKDHGRRWARGDKGHWIIVTWGFKYIISPDTTGTRSSLSETTSSNMTERGI